MELEQMEEGKPACNLTLLLPSGNLDKVLTNCLLLPSLTTLLPSRVSNLFEKPCSCDGNILCLVVIMVMVWLEIH